MKLRVTPEQMTGHPRIEVGVRKRETIEIKSLIKMDNICNGKRKSHNRLRNLMMTLR